MFFHTHTADAPWYVIKSDDKKRARINAMRLVLTMLPYPDKDESVVKPPDRLIVGTAADVLEADDIFTILMGDKVEPRREFIQSNALEVTELDI